MTTQKEHSGKKNIDRRYNSVDELLAEGIFPKEIQPIVQKHLYSSRLSLHLAKMRQIAGITQTEMSKKLNTTQSAISKLEAGTDESITIHHLKEYSRATGQRVSLTFGKPPSEMENITNCIDSLRQRIVKLAESANQDEQTRDKIKAFLGDASTNILHAVALCNSTLSIDENDSIEEVRVEIISNKKNITRPVVNQESCGIAAC